MADVTLSYKDSDILELSDSGSATLKTGGTYCEADIEVEYVKPSGGGIRSVDGTVTLASSANFPTITHNLGTKKVAGFIIPHYEIVASAGYQEYLCYFINWTAFISDSETWVKDFTQYNSTRFPNPITVTNSEIKTRLTDRGYSSPWTSQSDQWAGTYESGIGYTDNTVTFYMAGGNTYWSSGTYYYKVFALE